MRLFCIKKFSFLMQHFYSFFFFLQQEDFACRLLLIIPMRRVFNLKMGIKGILNLDANNQLKGAIKMYFKDLHKKKKQKLLFPPFFFFQRHKHNWIKSMSNSLSLSALALKKKKVHLVFLYMLNFSRTNCEKVSSD